MSPVCAQRWAGWTQQTLGLLRSQSHGQRLLAVLQDQAWTELQENGEPARQAQTYQHVTKKLCEPFACENTGGRQNTGSVIQLTGTQGPGTVDL